MTLIMNAISAYMWPFELNIFSKNQKESFGISLSFLAQSEVRIG
jgi:hypothetical protein